jgi:hypothetical protein
MTSKVYFCPVPNVSLLELLLCLSLSVSDNLKFRRFQPAANSRSSLDTAVVGIWPLMKPPAAGELRSHTVTLKADFHATCQARPARCWSTRRTRWY